MSFLRVLPFIFSTYQLLKPIGFLIDTNFSQPIVSTGCLDIPFMKTNKDPKIENFLESEKRVYSFTDLIYNLVRDGN